MRQIDLRKPEAIDLFVNSICYTAMNGPGLDGLFIDAIEWCVRSAAWRGLGWAPYGYVTLDAARGMGRVVALVKLAAREARCWVARTDPRATLGHLHAPTARLARPLKVAGRVLQVAVHRGRAHRARERVARRV